MGYSPRGCEESDTTEHMHSLHSLLDPGMEPRSPTRQADPLLSEPPVKVEKKKKKKKKKKPEN